MHTPLTKLDYHIGRVRHEVDTHKLQLCDAGKEDFLALCLELGGEGAEKYGQVWSADSHYTRIQGIWPGNPEPSSKTSLLITTIEGGSGPALSLVLTPNEPTAYDYLLGLELARTNRQGLTTLPPRSPAAFLTDNGPAKAEFCQQSVLESNIIPRLARSWTPHAKPGAECLMHVSQAHTVTDFALYGKDRYGNPRLVAPSEKLFEAAWNAARNYNFLCAGGQELNRNDVAVRQHKAFCFSQDRDPRPLVKPKMTEWVTVKNNKVLCPNGAIFSLPRHLHLPPKQYQAIREVTPIETQIEVLTGYHSYVASLVFPGDTISHLPGL